MHSDIVPEEADGWFANQIALKFPSFESRRWKEGYLFSAAIGRPWGVKRGKAAVSH